MKITLFLNDRILDFKLPNEISGSYSFDANEVENKLINVEARDGKWTLYATEESKILQNDKYVDNIELVANCFYILYKDNQKYLIYTTKLNDTNFRLYKYGTNLKLSIGNTPNNNIKYNCPYLNNLQVIIYINNNQLILEKINNGYLYVNKKIVINNAYNLNIGDVVEILGLKIYFINGLLMIKSPSEVQINTQTANIENFKITDKEKLDEKEIKDENLYKKEDYFSKAPRIRRLIEDKTIKFSNPPSSKTDEMPLALVIGPMMTMGLISAITLINTVSRIASKETTLEQSWMQLLTSGVMMLSMLLWPILTQAYNRHQRKKKAEELKVKYTEYLKEKKTILEQEKELEKSILLENLLSTEDCLNIIKQRKVNFWDKRIDQNDIMVARIGIGNELLKAKIEYNEEDFSLEENELKEQVGELIKEYKYIPNVPIGYSFYENKITAIMGSDQKILNFVNHILVQLLTFYSYEDLKIVVFTNKSNEKNWEYIKYLNHNFSNDKYIRFFGTDSESIKNVNEYLNFELNNRINQGKDKDLVKPYYFIITDDYEKIKHQDFIKLFTETDENYGFSLIILENILGNLPSKCSNFITLGQKSSRVLKNSYEKQEQVEFRDEIHSNINMMQIAKILSNIPIEFEDGIKELPNVLSFLEMEKVGKVEQLNILNRWNTNDSTASLKAEVGVNEQGDLMYLDLHEKFHGPHGLIAGMTGSGKSEFIITWILSMAINYSPDDIAFILIDYKGGGLAYAFENKANNIVLPHLAGTITNLDKAEMDRTLVSIDAEIKRRQKIFNESRDTLGESTIDIYKYQRFYKEGKLSEPIPHLFIICDEFAELKSQQPDFMDNLISVARIGRSLGVHLILATQKPSGVVNDQIWSNTKFRVCLKVQDESDSREMLKRPEAASIKQTGRFYLQVGFNEYFALGQSAWCGAKYYPSEKIIKQVDKSVNFINDCGMFIKSIQASGTIKIPPQGEQIAAILKSIIDVSKMANKKAKKLWLDNVPETILVDDLEKKYSFKKTPYNVEAIIGEYDAPEKQEQGVVKYNFLEDGNTIIYGIDGSERENLLNSLIYSSVKNYTPEELNYYIIDYGSESLGRWKNLPQVGGVVFLSEEEKYNNLLKLIKEEIQIRKKLFVEYGGEYKNYVANNDNKLPLKVIIINNYDSLYENDPNLYDDFPELVRDSERYGIIYILTANASNSVHNRVSQNFRNIYAFRLKDSSEYSSIFNTRVKITPREIDGRALLQRDVINEFQTASIVQNNEDINDYLKEFIEEQRELNQKNAKIIPTLPEIIRFKDIERNISNLKNIPIGIEKKEIEICNFDFQNNIGNIISANKLDYTKNFVLSLLEIFRNIKNINLMIIDSMKLLNLNKEVYQNYYTDNFDKVIESIDEYIKNLIDKQSQTEGIIFIYGISKLISKLGDQAKIENLIKHLKEYEKISIIIVDDANKVKNYIFESWFTSIFNVSDGIWVGRGISDQNLLRLSNITREMTRDCKNNMGYLISEGTSTYCKLIDFVTPDSEGE